MKKVRKFDHFMWLKVIGKVDGINISPYGAASVPSESLMKYQRNMKILKEHGIEYPNWKAAKEVLKERTDD